VFLNLILTIFDHCYKKNLSPLLFYYLLKKLFRIKNVSEQDQLVCIAKPSNFISLWSFSADFFCIKQEFISLNYNLHSKLEQPNYI